MRALARQPRLRCAMPSRRARTNSKLNWPSAVSHMLYERQQQAESRGQERTMATTQPSPATSPIGRDTPRIDGPRKVTGLAKYTSDFMFPGMLYAVLVEATIANGKLLTLDTAVAEKMPGVREALHRAQIGTICRSTPAPGFDRVCEERRPPFEVHVISSYGQYIATAVVNARSVLAQMFGLPTDNVLVISKFLGSGFGGKLYPWTHVPLAAAAARQLGKPLKLVVSRKMMFQSVGHRARTQQRVRLGANSDGKLVSFMHDYVYHMSMRDDYHEDCGEATPFHYSVPNLRVSFGRASRTIGATADMRR